ncbi:metal ABC transporter permease [Algoriphagus zhangzhouensis]|uniref:Manganese/zinc/iron transport system permease protein n=1 Tax=Algoriphagus zhangzhouensis TaxID=1073327 RepID=A0A1M7Z4S3_9BACT|nr:metal ABC transporter permease [Algoriphagus zhangzhouensis]TDY48777.1 manganese/zinc/iron transport system permease protein [Algoriphagus zhangzhouensis]SHO59938.1 manganese/zinc/iron transport system permease protein [Algoriphagus zhangzhouensis]
MITFDQNAFLIISTASLIAISCGLLGVFMMLRKMSMTGDAISHAVLPGIVIGYFISGSQRGVEVIVGAGLLGILATLIIDFLRKKAKVQLDASIGITFTLLFAIGIILINLLAYKVDLDQECVLYGEIAYLPIDLWITDSGFSMGPRIIWLALLNLLLVGSFIFLLFKELKLTSFDEGFGMVMGIPAGAINLALMSMVSYTTVSSFDAVGAILVVALLVVPPATAFLWTKDIKSLIKLTIGIGIGISVLGYYLAFWADSSIAGMMVTVGGAVFLISAVLTSKKFKFRLGTQSNQEAFNS